jgi:ABC-type uncharacterized transport system substrate-binding protein
VDSCHTRRAAPTPAVQAAKNATGTIPVVMAFAVDPERTGFVASLATGREHLVCVRHYAGAAEEAVGAA